MSRYVVIKEKEMRDFLSLKGFSEIKHNGTNELIMGKIIAPNTCLRCYTTIESGVSREKGEDAIRFVIVRKKADGRIYAIGSTKKVLRTKNWRSNMNLRIDNCFSMIGPKCPKCGDDTIRHRCAGREGTFYGCVNRPRCMGTISGDKK